jgi:hypothetical protein
MAFAGVAALLTFGHIAHKRAITVFVGVVGLGVAAWLVNRFGADLQMALALGKEGYRDEMSATSSSPSLGTALIISQPIPVRLTLGAAYLFLFPIPFWSGFQLDSAYHLFKSFNALFQFSFLPLLLLALRRIWSDKARRSPAVMFLLYLSVGATFAVAGSSMETRHHGAFFPSIFLLALVPDLGSTSDRRAYVRASVLVVSGVVGIHFAWAVLKFTS